ncbi:MAG: ABC transporter permease subunit [Tepidisphaera sp.]|nr:ABC transporter permease subunit [Tepidisphaera sp.]
MTSPANSPAHQRLARTLKLLGGVLLLAWAFQVSGMLQATKLWTNRHRAADYILGQRIDASTLATRRDEALREVRTDMQLHARDEIAAELKAKGEPTPSFMKLMSLAEEKTNAHLREMSQAELDALVDQRLAAQGVSGDRRGGYFPPETSPKAIFGDPEDLGRLSPPLQWLVNRADHAGYWTRSAVRWTISALTGDAGYTGALLETIAIAVWGTLLAVLLAIPTALFGADRTLHIILPGQARWQQGARASARFVVRRSFDIARGFNEIVLAMILVAVLGLGPLPGVLALLIHTYGVLGKVFSEAMETADFKPIEGVQSTGARSTQVVMFAVLPQITPYVVSQSLLRFESNVRGATILGVVGAGGIGQLLMDKFGAYKFPEVATMMAIIIVVVTLIDFACGRVMKRVA